jgi:hypothetical protein
VRAASTGSFLNHGGWGMWFTTVAGTATHIQHKCRTVRELRQLSKRYRPNSRHYGLAPNVVGLCRHEVEAALARLALRRPLAGAHGLGSVAGAQGLPVRRSCSTQDHCCGVKGNGVPRGTGCGAGASGAATTGGRGDGCRHQATTSPTTVNPTRSHAARRTNGRGVTHQQTQVLRDERCSWRLVG